MSENSAVKQDIKENSQAMTDNTQKEQFTEISYILLVSGLT